MKDTWKSLRTAIIKLIKELISSQCFPSQSLLDEKERKTQYSIGSGAHFRSAVVSCVASRNVWNNDSLVTFSRLPS